MLIRVMKGGMMVACCEGGSGLRVGVPSLLMFSSTTSLLASIIKR